MIISGQTFTGKVGVAFNATPTATGSISLWRAILPAGLSLNASTGAITGTPEKAGSLTSLFTDKAFATGVLNGGTSSSQGYYYHALRSDGTVVGWGADSTGASVPAGLTDVVEISRSLALKRDGTVVGIGYGVAPSGLTNVAALGNNLVLKKDGTLFAWGDNTYGQATVPTGSDFVAVASGNMWHVALKSNGTVAGWGRYNSGLLDTTDIAGVTAIAAGTDFYLTLHEDGSVFSRAGSNNQDDIWNYTPSATHPKAIAIAAGSNRSLVLLEDGTVYRYGDVGYPATFGIVQGLSGVVAIGANSSFSAVKNDGSVVRWGETLTQNTPVSVTGVSASPFSLSSSIPVLFEFTSGVPIIISGQTFSGGVGVSFNRVAAITDSVNRPVTSWTATGLPTWASLNASTGVITGTPTAFESSTITLTATGPGGSDTETATISISQAIPIISSGQSFSGSVTSGSGLAFNGQITTQDSANRPVSSWSATGLPPGLSINSAGIVSGFPDQAGEFTALVTATGPAGSDTELVSFSIAIGAPLISGNQIFNGEIGVNFTATITSDNTTNRPVTSWAASGLPSWASFNTTTAVISGLPTTDANTVVTLTATGPGGNSSRTVTINIHSLQGGTIVLGRTVTRVGNWSPTDLSFAGTVFFGSGYRWRTEPVDSGDSGTIPPGMSISPFDNARANITGTPSALGRYRGRAIFEYSADFSNYQTKGQSPFDVKVIGLPQIVSAQIFSGVIGEPFSVTLAGVDTANRPVTRWSATGLPEWASMSATGIISGIPVANGEFAITLIAMGPAGTTTSPATIIVAAGPPRITLSQIFTGRQGFIFTEVVPSLENVANRPVTSWSATGLPDGLSINPDTGMITGTPTGHGEFSAILTAIGSGGEDSEPILFLIAQSIPIFAGALRAAAVYAGATQAKALYYGSSLLWNSAGWEPSTLQNNLLAFYKLNDDGTGGLSLSDSSGNNCTLTNSNSVSLSTGAIQGAALFAGTGHSLSASISLNTAQPYTISMWVNVATLRNYFSLFAGSVAGTLNIHGDSSGGLSWNNGASGDFSQSAFFTANQWIHCVFLRGSANAMSIYKNGTLVKTATGSTNYSPITQVDIGNVRHMGGFEFSGRIDALGVWNRALTTAEIAKLYKSGTGFEF